MIDPATLEYAEFEFASFPCLEAAKKVSSLAEKIKTVVYGEDRGARFAWKAVASNLIYAANRRLVRYSTGLSSPSDILKVVWHTDSQVALTYVSS